MLSKLGFMALPSVQKWLLESIKNKTKNVALSWLSSAIFTIVAMVTEEVHTIFGCTS